MKNYLINFIFLFIFVFGSMSFYPLIQEEDGGEVVFIDMKTATFEYQIPEKFVYNNHLTTTMTLTFRNQNNGNVYAMSTILLEVSPIWNLSGTFELEMKIGDHVQVHDINL